MLVRSLASLVLVLSSSLAAAAPIAEPPTGSGDLVVSLSDGFGGMAENPRRVLEVWGDGRVVVTRPPFQSGSARAQAAISPAAVRALVQRLAEEGVLGFDADAVKAELARADAQRRQAALQDPGSVRIVQWTDPDPSTLQVRVARWLPEGEGGPVHENVVVHIDWLGVIADAQRQPDVAAIAGLRRAQDEVRALLALPGLR